MNKSCMVRVQEGDLVRNLWISEGSYRFFQQLSYIACSPQGNGSGVWKKKWFNKGNIISKE
jgi:hypothetical protein